MNYIRCYCCHLRSGYFRIWSKIIWRRFNKQNGTCACVSTLTMRNFIIFVYCTEFVKFNFIFSLHFFVIELCFVDIFFLLFLLSIISHFHLFFVNYFFIFFLSFQLSFLFLIFHLFLFQFLFQFFYYLLFIFCSMFFI